MKFICSINIQFLVIMNLSCDWLFRLWRDRENRKKFKLRCKSNGEHSTRAIIMFSFLRKLHVICGVIRAI
jgi:hypothetical protein